MININKEYSIIWKQFSKDSDLGKHLNANEDFALPYFIDGVDKEKFKISVPMELSEMNLLRGILVGNNDNPPTIDSSISKSYYGQILNDLKDHFKFESIEKLILDTSAYLRKENGDSASLHSLLTGIELIPNSSLIKFDCCVDIFNLLERNEYADIDKGRTLLSDLSKEIDITKINPDFVKHIDEFEYWLKKDSETY